VFCFQWPVILKSSCRVSLILLVVIFLNIQQFLSCKISEVIGLLEASKLRHEFKKSVKRGW
jgi:hypothetical protein